jgi:hypothetical protein
MALANVGGSNEHPRELRRDPLLELLTSYFLLLTSYFLWLLASGVWLLGLGLGLGPRGLGLGGCGWYRCIVSRCISPAPRPRPPAPELQAPSYPSPQGTPDSRYISTGPGPRRALVRRITAEGGLLLSLFARGQHGTRDTGVPEPPEVPLLPPLRFTSTTTPLGAFSGAWPRLLLS